jgi:hypothetical protein
MKLTTAERKVHRAARRLERSATMGKVGRRNARRAMLTAVHHLLAAMDAEYPAVRAPRQESRRLTPIERKRKLRARGWVDCQIGTAPIPACAIAGVKIIRDPCVQPDGTHGVMVPGWVIEMRGILGASYTIEELARLLKRYKRDRVGRAQVISEAILKSGAGDQI